MIIRPETPADFEAIAAVVEAAFGRPNEARLVELIRASEHYVSELALVAEENGIVLGQIMFSYVTLEREEDELGVFCLAPVAVTPDRQNEGIGGALIRDGIARADARGEPLIVLLGHPSYYARFGFEPAGLLGIEPPRSDYGPAFMTLRLSNYDERSRGRLVWPPAFQESGAA